jgi:hypothetical protein
MVGCVCEKYASLNGYAHDVREIGRELVSRMAPLSDTP